jgi:EAL domain-containing protein (putative c-di-GMP-specific phosphodiesterase class I)
MDIPVILMTATPKLETAMIAVNLGAYRYLVKPVSLRELERLVRRAAMMRGLAKLRREALAAIGAENLDRHSMDSGFTKAIDGVWMAYQPIVEERGTSLVGFEALLRTHHASVNAPLGMLAVAQRLERTHELGRVVRETVARDADSTPDGSALFVNVLAQDLSDPNLYDAGAPLTSIASRVILELTEHDSLDGVADIRRRVQALREMGFRFAVDDLGAGHSGLTSLTQIEPDVVKLDRSLVRGVHESPHRQAIVRSMVDLCRSLGITVIAEGVELPEEAESLYELGVNSLQGFYFAYPNRDIVWPLAGAA